MEARYAFRKRPLLDECPMAPEIFEQVMPRLSTFMQPFGRIFQGQAADQHATTSVCGLLSNVERKNIASMAYRFGQSRLPLPSGLGWDAWDDAPLREELRGQVKTHLGQRRWGVGVRSFWVSQVRAGVGGGGKAVVWPPGKSRERPRSPLLGRGLPQGAHLGRHPAVSAQRMDQGDDASGQSGRAHSVPGLAHASPGGPGEAGETRCRAAASVDGG